MIMYHGGADDYRPSIAQLVERWTVVVEAFQKRRDIHRSLVRIRLEGIFFVERSFFVQIIRAIWWEHEREM